MQSLSFKTKDVVSYAFFPRIVPRIRSVFFSGFGYVAFLMAQIYGMVRLLPSQHPYLQPSNIGRFGMYHVVVEAAGQLKFSKKNVDQVFVFFALLAAIIIVILQLLFLLYGIAIGPFINPAHAFSWFDNPTPLNDLAFNILNDVFGINNMFCSSYFPGNCPANNPPFAPFPFHAALHELFRFYSTALLLIGTLVFLYFVFVLVLETAVTGIPFGQRFQHVWVPIRLIVAVGLLIPQNFGMNSAQYIVLYAAKYGSNMATQGWIDFNTAIAAHMHFGGGGPLTGNPTGERYSLVAMPQEVDVTSVFQAMTIVHSCAFAYMLLTGRPPGEPATPYNITDDYTAPATNFMIKPWLVKRLSPWTTAAANLPAATPPNPAIREPVTNATTPTYTDAIGFYYGGDIVIRFGEYITYPSGAPVYKDDEGYVAPLCGDIRIPIVDLSDVGNGAANGGPDYMLEFYYTLVLNMWFNDPQMLQFARTMVTVSARHAEAVNFCSNAGAYAGLSGCGTPGFQACGTPCEENPPFSQFKSVKMGVLPPAPGGYQTLANNAAIQAWGLYTMNTVSRQMTAQIFDRGWAGAGIWYNRIAEVNGTFINSVRAIPQLSAFPLVMEQIRSEKQKLDSGAFGPKDMFDPTIKAASGTDPAKLKIDRGDAELDQIGVPLQNLWSYWQEDKQTIDHEETQDVSNIMVKAINMILGTSGLVNIRGANAHIHPLAQLVAVGKGLIDNAVGHLLASTATAFMGGFLSVTEDREIKALGGAFEVVSSLLEITAFVGITAGFVLYYVLPFLPFVYFFFAVGSWVKAIFEAMVAVPLWALAHLRIDGDGLPGDAASNGYFLILEIFIRPILSVVGLVAAISIFSTQVRVLNLIWDMVTANVAGFSDSDIFATLIGNDVMFKGTPLDQFFYTIIYTIVCYMLAVSSFKLIDKIPDNILRWAGSGVSSFGDIDQDHVESLNRYVATGGMTVGSQAIGAVRGASSGLGSSLAQMVKSEKGAASS
ncbi:MAG: DotA/TraY family protein [Alphaproteobacteria bacterium]|nr:DotA/TraY family protein [Alphaproteobacteria bacterium]MBP7761490.1 DotA/TraY family protein [Alphaproteobacteria bacterium]MBP7905021.1 DotA/TraY family protein [Alphaproteobacteria bacterium]